MAIGDSDVHSPPGYEVVQAPFSTLSASQVADVAHLHRQAWPSDAGRFEGPDPDLYPWLLALATQGRIVCSVTILSKSLHHDSVEFRASGISAMVTDTASRGHGLGRWLATRALSVMSEAGADVGLFTCDRELQTFYEAAGWKVLPGTVLVGGTIDDPFPSDQFDKVTMAAFCTEHALEHQQSFVMARIGLYPGSIDRLW